MSVRKTEPVRILHVDDEPGFGEMVATYLERERDAFDVVTATSAREDLERLVDAPGAVDCIVSDYDMSGMDGLEFLETVREERPDLPFVLFTGRGSEEIASEAISLGVTDYLQKETGTEQYQVLANRVENAVEAYRAERRLERSEKCYQNLVENSPAGIVLHTPEDGILFANDAAAEVYGADDPRDLLDVSALDLVHPADAGKIKRCQQRSLEGEALEPLELRFVSFDGETRYLTVASMPATYEGERVVQSVLTDVTEQRRAEQELREEREFTERALNALDDVFSVSDPSGQLQRWNDQLPRVSGYTDAELAEMSLTDFVTDADREPLVETLAEMGETGHATTEVTVETKDGERIPYELNGSTITDDEGAVVAISGTGRDITEHKRHERELERYETAIEAAPVGVFVLDDEGVIEWGNERAGSFVGHDTADLIDKPFRSLIEDGTISKDAVGKYSETLRELLSSDNDRCAGNYEITVTPAAGCEIPLRVHVSPLPYDEAFEGAVLVAEDITERRHRQKELRAAQARFRALTENVDFSVITINEDNVVQYANETVEEMFGYTPDELVGQSLELVVPDRLERTHSAAVERYLREGDRHLNWEWVELPARHRDGHEFPVGISFGEYVDGETHFFSGVLRDVSKRHKHETSRRRLYEITADTELTTGETIERVLELGCEYFGMESGFLTQIEDGTQRIVKANSPHEAIQPGSECPLSESYCRETIEMDELMTVTQAGAVGWEDDPAYDRFGLEAYIGGKITVDGEAYGTICFADRAPREDQFSEIEQSFVDLVTRGVESTLERHKHDVELERQNEQLQEFSGVISHDLRNPLTVANGYLELACETGDAEYFSKVESAHDRMDAIIEDVLTLARHGEMIGGTTPVALETVATDAWENVETKDAKLVRDGDLGEVDADESRLKQLFENIYRNTIEHAGAGATVRIGRSATGFYIEDDGPGIPDEDCDSVFDSAYTTSDEGTGLGLSIVDTIVSAHGWEIEVNNGIDGGARFEIQLEMTRGDPNELALNGWVPSREAMF